MLKVHHVFNKFTNWMFAGIGCILIVQELQNYFLVKPTSLEETSTLMGLQHAPEIILCPEPSFRLSQMQRMGFKGETKKM